MPTVKRELVDRLASQLRSLHQADRGRYLRATFREANDGVLARLVSRLVAATEPQLRSWLRLSDEARRDERRDASRREQAEQRWGRFIGGMVWPGHADALAWPGFNRWREVGSEGGAVWSAKLGRDVEYESGLEHGLIRLFEASPWVIKYCEQALSIGYRWCDGPRVYIPDFALRLRDGRAVLVEGKPQIRWADAANLAEWNAASPWCAERGWGFVVHAGRHHPGDLVGTVGPADGEILERRTAAGPAQCRRLQSAWFGSGRSWKELLATALTFGFA